MAVPLWSAVHGKVLGTCQQLAILAVVWTLQSAHHGKSHLCCQIGVFAIGLLSASPSWITEDIDVGCPEGETLIAAYHTVFLCQLVLGTCFIAHSGECLLHQPVVPR